MTGTVRCWSDRGRSTGSARGLTALGVLGLLLISAGPGVCGGVGPLGLVRSMSLGAEAHDIAIVDGLAYVAIDTGLVILDLADPASPVEVGRVATGTPSVTQGVEVAGTYAYLASREAGVHVVDVSNHRMPRVVGAKSFATPVWDVAVKGTFVYAVTFGGEMYVLDVSQPASPRQVKVIGLPAWSSPKHDAANLKKLNAHVTGGSAKATGVSVSGNLLVTTDWNYGHLYAYDVSSPGSPVFKGAHWVPFLLRAEADPAKDVVYMLVAYSKISGIYTVPISLLAPTRVTHYKECPQCRFLKSKGNIDQGGLGLSPGGDRLFYGGGHREFHVVDVVDPDRLHDLAFAEIDHGLGLAEIMGFASRGDFIYVAAGVSGLQVYSFPSASD